MEYILTKEEMYRYDTNTSVGHKIPEAILMERAALGMYEDIMHKHIANMEKPVLILSGIGNNGGDGLALGRLLMLKEVKVKFIVSGDGTKASKLNVLEQEIIESYGGKIEYIADYNFTDLCKEIYDKKYSVCVDALYGIGLSRPINENYACLFDAINSADMLRIAVDIPSGVDASGNVLGDICFQADITYTFGFLKRAHVFMPGIEKCGEVKLISMGIDEKSIVGDMPTAKRATEMSDFSWPVRKKNANKGTYKKLLLIAGNEQIAGAALLSAGASFAAGIGMLMVITHEANRYIFNDKYPEAMVTTYNHDKDSALIAFNKGIEWADGIVIGPGIGLDNIAKSLVVASLLQKDKPVLFDADAINIIASSDEIRDCLKNSNNKFILTPHVMEFSRLMRMSISDIKNDICGVTKKAADEFGCTIICKDAVSVIASCKEDCVYVNTSGCEGMATAGSGDVLAGIGGVMMLQMESEYEAIAAAAYIHGIAGNEAANMYGSRAMTAGNITEMLKGLWA